MAGIYIHIPFCTQRCFYCDFYSTTETNSIDKLVDSLILEIDQRKDFLNTKSISTIYFGGGTPSLLLVNDIEKILNAIKNQFEIETDCEITFEVNPDDLTPDYLYDLKNIGINRLSIGIQSFIDRDLQLMNRRHNSSQAIEAVKTAQDIGFNNISIDLIYGIPDSSSDDLKYNLDKAFSLNIQHLSAYHLTIEEGTVFHKLQEKGKLIDLSENESIEQFRLLSEYCEQNKFVPYEISNFALDGYFSKHNSNYWFQKEYLGIGPSAHSFNINSRTWNISSLSEYITKTEKGELFYEKENLSKSDKYNDYILTRLRTIWGINLGFIEDYFGEKYLKHSNLMIDKYIKSKHIYFNNKHYCLTKEGRLISNSVISDFFYVDE